MSLSASFYKALRLYIADKTDYSPSEIEIISFDQQPDGSGSDGCDTCGHGATADEIVAFIEYQVSTYKTRYTYMYDGGFAELIRELDKVASNDD